MKRLLILILALSPTLFAQETSTTNVTVHQRQNMAFISNDAPPVQGAPYSATINNESVQVLSDGNRIVQSSTGTIARDSQGRSRRDTQLPVIGNLSAANAPHLVFIQDPVAQTSYLLNLTDKTAQKLPMPPPLPGTPGDPGKTPGTFFFAQVTGAPPPGPLPPPMAIDRTLIAGDQDQETTEDLGSQVMEGINVKGTRTTRTIPANQIGNEKPILITTEVWTSPDLKAVVYSKRNDPRVGEQTFHLTNIVRGEPDSSLLTVPADFKIVDGPQKIVYRTNQ
jgi:hypothetical protein